MTGGFRTCIAMTGSNHGHNSAYRIDRQVDGRPDRRTSGVRHGFLEATSGSRRPLKVELLVVVGLVGGIMVTHEVGFWLGSLSHSADDPFDRQVALVRGSTAALVAFLIGFAFSGAASRFIDRVDIIVKEANALGTAYLRADTIAEPQRGELKAARREYTADRVQLLSGERRDQIEPCSPKSAACTNGCGGRQSRARKRMCP